MSTLAETVTVHESALRRGAGRLDLYISYDHGSDQVVAAMYTGDDVAEVALAHEETLADALDSVRHSFGAAVREAVNVP